MTGGRWTPWRVGGIAAVLVVGGLVVARMLVLQRRRSPAPDPAPGPDPYLGGWLNSARAPPLRRHR
ncbi:hypothetical protein DVA86_17565 [Streptomyces armeniacus]|uniref:Uncharacterized protein n=1 Tax=Streptomyces armeniacus TaxID=83291 RepID=A0A345XRC5_9ACTN|nr:hypothetical protein [Streptomyces armeniacus]AXK34191.1 hypothetical protein DVA86_17565 [Streptomyces armeniacus]